MPIRGCTAAAAAACKFSFLPLHKAQGSVRAPGTCVTLTGRRLQATIYTVRASKRWPLVTQSGMLNTRDT